MLNGDKFYDTKVSTHSRLKAAGSLVGANRSLAVVSTHSRLKAAGLGRPVDAVPTAVFQHTAA